MQNYGSFIASNFLPPAASIQITTGGQWQYIEIQNNSPYQLNINFGGMGQFTMPEMFKEDFLLTRDYRNTILITPSVNITSSSHAASNMIVVNAWAQGEKSKPQAQPLQQQAVTATASGKPLFSATFGVGSSVSSVQALNVFNPLGSGINYTFHSARFFTNEADGAATGNIIYLAGADLNLGTAVSAVSHDGSTNPRVSTAHVTAEDTGTAHGGTLIETQQEQVSTTQDLLAFPDSYTLTPGGQFRITCVAGGGSPTGHIVRLTLKWEEDVSTSLPGGLPNSIGTSLINLGNPAPTPIITATPAGDNGTAVLLTNNANFTLGDVTNPGSFTLQGLMTLASSIIDQKRCHIW